MAMFESPTNKRKTKGNNGVGDKNIGMKSSKTGDDFFGAANVTGSGNTCNGLSDSTNAACSGDEDEVERMKRQLLEELQRKDKEQGIEPTIKKPSWVSDLRNAWDQEIRKNMPEHKKTYFLQFPDSSDDEGSSTTTTAITTTKDGSINQNANNKVKKEITKNKKIRRHMKHFINNMNSKQVQNLQKIQESQENSNKLTMPEQDKPPSNTSSPSSSLEKSVQSSPVTDHHDDNDDNIESSSTDDDEEDEDDNQKSSKKNNSNSFLKKKRIYANDNKSRMPASLTQVKIGTTPLSPTMNTSTSFAFKNPASSEQQKSITNSNKNKNVPPKRRQSLLELLFPSKQPEKIHVREQLTKFLAKLNKFLDECAMVINELKLNEKYFKRSARKEIALLKEYYLFALIPLFRDLSATRLVRLKLRRSLERGCKQLIANRIKLTKQAIKICEKQNEDSEEIILPPYVDDNFFNVDGLLSSDQKLSKKWRQIKSLDAKATVLGEKYISMKKTFAKQKSRKDITESLQKLVNKIPKEKLEQNLPEISQTTRLRNEVFDGDEQMEFDSIVGDERTEEGKSIRKFLNEIKKYNLERVPPSEITGYIESYVTYVAKMHKIVQSQQIETLTLLTTRFIFSLIGLDLFLIEKRAQEEVDSKFFDQIQLLSKLTPMQLGVDIKFLPPKYGKEGSNLVPYSEAIDILGYIAMCSTPNDMLGCVYYCARSIHEEAKAFCEKHSKPFSFAADEFFPILVFVVIQSSSVLLHSHISFINKFLVDIGERNSEVMYFLTCLESAVMYITDINEEEIQNLTKEAPSVPTDDPSSPNDGQYLNQMKQNPNKPLSASTGKVSDYNQTVKKLIVGEENDDDDDITKVTKPTSKSLDSSSYLSAEQHPKSKSSHNPSFCDKTLDVASSGHPTTGSVSTN